MRQSPRSRRAFLGQAVAAGLLFGLPLEVRAEAAAGPDPLVPALRAMRARHLHGVVLSAPTDDVDRNKLLQELWMVLGVEVPSTFLELGERGLPHPALQPDAELLRLLRRAVVVCLPEDRVRVELVRCGASAVLIDAARTVIDALPPAPDLCAASFTMRLTPLVDGPDGARLLTTAKTQRSALTPVVAGRVAEALSGLGSPAQRRRRAASDVLRPLAPRLGAVLELAWREASSLEVRARIDDLLGAERPSVLPYGVTCNELRPPRPGCGLAHTPPPVDTFLQLITRPR